MFDVVTLSAERRAVKAIYKETFYLIKLATPGDAVITGSRRPAFSGLAAVASQSSGP
jgi:hypothetical protein